MEKLSSGSKRKGVFLYFFLNFRGFCLSYDWEGAFAV